MSQNLINDLTDRVSALTARLDATLVRNKALESVAREAQYVLAERDTFEHEARVMAEWLGAIKNHIAARGACADVETVLHYAQEALSGNEPHWLTPEYLNKARDPRAYYQERFRNAD